MSKREVQIGKAGEELALNVLAGRGVRIPERIATPAKMVGGRMIYEGKVSGDINGILDNGIRVIAEVKTIRGRNLRWSDLRGHQPGRLDINKRYNAIQSKLI